MKPKTANRKKKETGHQEPVFLILSTKLFFYLDQIQNRISIFIKWKNENVTKYKESDSHCLTIEQWAWHFYLVTMDKDQAHIKLYGWTDKLS